MFVDSHELENFGKSTEQNLLPVTTFTEYKKSLKVHLKSIEEKLGQGFCLLAINLYNQKHKTRVIEVSSMVSGI